MWAVGIFWREMVVKITSSTIPKIEVVYFCTVVLADTNGNTCGRELKGDEKQLIDLDWPNYYAALTAVLKIGVCRACTIVQLAVETLVC